VPKLKKRHRRWFEIPDDPLRGEVEIVHLSKTEIQDIMTRGIDTRVITKAGADGGPGVPETQTKVNNSLIRSEVAVAAVKNWKNFQDQDGKALECTPENVPLFARDDEFMAQLTRCREILGREVAEQEEAERKNSKALSSGQPA
jgi:hypothetical protein